MKKMYFSLALILAMLLLACTAFAEEIEKTSKDMNFYFISDEYVQPMTVYFIGESDVPYMSLEDYGELFSSVMQSLSDPHEGEESYGLAFSQFGEIGKLTRTDGLPYPMTVDCAADTITFFDYDAWLRPEADRVLIDVLSADGAHSEEEKSLFHRTDKSYERYGDPVVVDCGAYGIDLIADETGVYVPLQTLSDFTLSMNNVNAFYNGEIVAIVPMSGFEGTTLGEMFYSVEPKERSEAMGAYSFAELCLALDNLYGLKEVHGIHSFAELADQIGAREVLMGPDPNQADAALFTMIWKHMDDMHSAFLGVSPFSREGLLEDFRENIGYGQQRDQMVRQMDLYASARAEAYPDGVPGYEEIGNTAYITFDQFLSVSGDVDYYETAPTADAEDTVGLMIYAYSQIMREDSPIENVVLDLSNNGGGEADAAIFVLSAFLGDGYASIKNTLSGALATGVYNVDLNLDGKFDENDRGLLNKRRFALITPNSFSCGNLVPSVFKNSNEVTLIGRTSGGGSCVVLPLATAYGTNFRISGPQRLAFARNGSFYDIDQGAEPDFSLMFPESFYDREALTEYINTIK